MLTPSGDFLDTAAVVSGISIVVAVDTAIVHLAGSLGVPTVVLLSYVPDFRWLLSRTDSPWYPDLHLLRQSAPGDWGSIASLLEDTVLSLLKN
jgi:ADP-heptose:LPS heptosyltransferase